MSEDLRTRTAHTLKWNIVDRLSTQVLYAVTGIVLARLLDQEAFGLVGAVLIFQAFGTILVDSGFNYALLQKKEPTQGDYSTVFWFNMAMGAGVYLILYLCAPLIAMCFKNDPRLIPLSRMMFLVLILNATSSVQVSRFMKQMQAAPIALANTAGLVAGGVTGIWLAVKGFGAWAIVWQGLALAAVKSAALWIAGHWRPSAVFDTAALRSFAGLGTRMLGSAFLNTLFLNIYSFFVGSRAGLVPLGYYTQSDKWSKMGVTAITQTLTSTFVPPLAAVQDQPERFANMCSRMTRFTAWLAMPALLGLAAMATPVFHTLFGSKWDPSIILFQLLLVRGVFMVFNSLSGNFLLALGKASIILKLEVWRDTLACVALAATFPFMTMSLPDNPVYGLEIMLWGQLAATVITWIITMARTLPCAGLSWKRYLSDIWPYTAVTLVIVPLVLLIPLVVESAVLQLVLEAAAGISLYLLINALAGSKIQSQAWEYVRGMLHR